MLRFPWTSRRNNIGNIGYRNTYITGKVSEVQSTGGKYKVNIAGSDESYPNIWSIAKGADYEENETVGILWEYGNREKPVVAGVLRNVTYIETSSSVNSLGI